MRRFTPTAAYALSAAAHLGIFAWAWSLPARAHRPDKVDVEIVETVKPRPVEPKAPPPEPPKPAEPVKMRPAKRIAMKAPPPPTNEPPPETPPPETPPPTSAPAAPGPVHLGLSLSSTSTGGGFSAPVGNSFGGKPGGRPTAPSAGENGVGPLARAAALTVQPEPIDCTIPDSEYPKEARDVGFEGSVDLRIIIDSSGRVHHARVIKDPGYGLGAAAAKSVLHCRFKAGEIDGKATAVEWDYRITYEIPN